MEQLVLELKEDIKKISKFKKAISIIRWDMRMEMPKEAIKERAEIIESLSNEIFEMKTSERMEKLIDKIDLDKLSKEDKSMVKKIKKECKEIKGIPKDLYSEFNLAKALSENAWQKAKIKNDFNIYKPYLKKLLELQKEIIKYTGSWKHQYDYLLGNYEEGLTVEALDNVFSELKVAIIEVLDKIKNRNKEIDNSFLLGTFNKKKKENFSKFLVKEIGFDFNRGRLDETIHPFTVGFNNKDVRISTNYNQENITSAIFTSIHEGGHGIYEQNIPEKYTWTGLDKAASMSIHESQSRFYENILGRSKSFWKYFLPYLKYEFKELEDISLEDFYRAINKVEPTVTRIYADELTYNLHIIIRYEIEKGLIEGTIDIDNLKDKWNEKYEEYLGIKILNDGDGLLQDVHWASALFGYFPSYTLGNIYAAQLLNKIKTEYIDLEKDIEIGDFEKIKLWFTENIYKYGAVYSGKKIMKLVTGEELNTKYFIDYLREKYFEIYEIK